MARILHGDMLRNGRSTPSLVRARLRSYDQLRTSYEPVKSSGMPSLEV